MRFYTLLAFITLSLASCSYMDSQPGMDVKTSPSPSSIVHENGKVLLGFSADSNERRVFQPIINRFNEQNSDIQVQFVDTNQQLSRNEQLNIADTSAVIYLEESDLNSGYLRDLSPFIQSDKSFNKDDYYAGLFERVSGKNGATYGIPYLVQLPMLHYNKSIFDNKGIPVPGNWSWNDFIAYIQSSSDNAHSGREIYGFLDESTGANTLLAALNASNSNAIYKESDSNEVIRIDTPDVKQAVEEVVRLYNEKAFYTREQAGLEGIPIERLIQDNRVAMWPSYMFSYEQNTGEKPINMGTLVYPNSSIPNITPGYNFVMSVGTKYSLQAWRWLSFLSKQYLDGLGIPINDIGWSPARRTVREIFVKHSKLNENDISMQERLLERADNLNVKMFNTEAVSFIRQTIDKVLRQKLTVQEALQESQVELANAYANSQKAPTQVPNPVVVVPTLQPVNQPQQKTITVSFSALNDANQKLLIDKFNKENKDLFVKIIDPNSIHSSNLEGLAQNVDCFTWDFAPKQKDLPFLLDMGPLMDADASFDQDDYLRGLLQTHNFGDRYYGIPYAFIPQRVLYYDKNIFNHLNLNYPAKTWSIDDFFQSAIAMRSTGNNNPTYGFASPDLMTSDLDSLLVKFQAKLHVTSNGKTRVDFTSTENKKAIQKYIDLIKKTSPHSQLQNYRSDDNQIKPVEALVKGKVGMWFDRLEELKYYSQSNTNIGATLSPYGWNPIDADDYIMPSFYISANTTKSQECWEVIKYLQNNEEFISGVLPVRKSKANTNSVRQQNSDTLVEEYLSLLDRPLTIENSIDIDYYWLYRAIDRSIQGQDLDQELAEAEQFTNKYIDCLGRGESSSICATSIDPTYKGDALLRS